MTLPYSSLDLEHIVFTLWLTIGPNYLTYIVYHLYTSVRWVLFERVGCADDTNPISDNGAKGSEKEENGVASVEGMITPHL